jgi:hypothetical protein
MAAKKKTAPDASGQPAGVKVVDAPDKPGPDSVAQVQIVPTS